MRERSGEHKIGEPWLATARRTAVPATMPRMAKPRAAPPPSSASLSRPLGELLAAWKDGDAEAFEEVVLRIDATLRSLAVYLGDDTPDPVALVHAAYLELLDGGAPCWTSRISFYTLAAPLARRLAVDAARSASRAAAVARDLGEGDAAAPSEALETIALDHALDRLETLARRQARILELRHFAALTVDEIAAALDLSTDQVLAEEREARAWLRLALEHDRDEAADAGSP